jgi:hypothetical protein
MNKPLDIKKKASGREHKAPDECHRHGDVLLYGAASGGEVSILMD